MIDQQKLFVLCYLSNLKSNLKVNPNPLLFQFEYKSLVPNPVKGFRDITNYYTRVRVGVKRLRYLVIQIYELKTVV